MNDEALVTEAVLPHNLDVEKSVLGSLIVDTDAFARVVQILTAVDFYSPKHQDIFRAVEELQAANIPVDFLQLEDLLAKKDQLERIGGRGYLYSLSEEIVSTANVEQHAKIIAEKSKRRKMIHFANFLRNETKDERNDVTDLIEDSLKKLYDINQGRKKQFESIKTIAKRVFENLEELAKSKRSITGHTTGYKILDRVTLGFKPSELIILAARPAMGKTSFALNLAYNVAVKAEKTVGFFSLEMPSEQLGGRIMASAAAIGLKHFQLGDLRPEQWPALARVVGKVSKAKMWVDDSPDLSIAEIRTKARQLQAMHGLDMIVIDYLQLITLGKAARYNMNKTQEVSEISRYLKNIARELNVPVLALAQLNRQTGIRTDKRPMLQDLRDSGAIEQDADVVMFIHREDYWEKEKSKKPGVAEIIIAKNRNGQTTTVELTWEPTLTTFYDNSSKESEQNG